MKFEDMVTSLRLKYPSLLFLDKIKIRGDNSSRVVTCFCCKECNVSLVPHLRKVHPEVWHEWNNVFIEMKNLGFNAKQTINLFRADNRFLFSWSVVEKEILSRLEENPSLLKMDDHEIKEWAPKSFELETSTIWSFPTRGTWATHKNSYRGNWPPELVRNLLLTYTKSKNKVLDVFAGGGTTLIESWLLGRKSIGLDISPISEKVCGSRLALMKKAAQEQNKKLDPSCEPIFILGDSRNSDKLIESAGWKIGGIDLVCAHPPYLNALSYSKGIDGELSAAKSVDDFSKGLEEIISSSIRCLKKGGRLALLIGDVRRKGSLIPLGFVTVGLINKSGLILDQVIIKAQHNDTSTNLYKRHSSLEYLIAHEYLFIAKKV